MAATLSYEQARSELRGRLGNLLVDSNLLTPGKNKIKCLNPNHNDRNPSMQVWTINASGEELVHCFSCGATYDIFTVNHLITKAPLMGFEFITDNLKPLCDKFGVEFDPRPMTAEEIERMNMRSALSMVKNTIIMNVLKGKVDPSVVEYMEGKELGDDASKISYQLGYVEDYLKFTSDLKAKGLNDQILEKIGIEQYIFGPNNLIFVVSDEFGNPRGFAARNCDYEKSDESATKYFNSKASEFYNKKHLLYNLNRALKKTNTVHNSLYIVEGYTDAIALDKYGFKAAALCGTAFSAEHISLLQRTSIQDMVILLDGDAAGQAATGKIVTKLMEGIRGFRVRLAYIPEGHDPDSYVREFGKDGIVNLKHITTFEWRLQELKDKTDLDGYELAKQVIPLIVNEKSYIEQERMLRQLSDIAGISADVLRKEVNIINSDKKQKTKEESNSVIDNLVKNLKSSPDDGLLLLQNGMEALRNVSMKNNQFIYDETEAVEHLQLLELKQENPENSESVYFRDMPILESQLDGNLVGKVMFLGAQPNAGKTSFLLNMIASMLTADEACYQYDRGYDENRDNDLGILFHSVDDTRDDIIPRIIAIIAAEKFKRITINLASSPYKFKEDDLQQKNLFLQARKEAYETLIRWAREGRLVIKDVTHGKTLSSSKLMMNVLQQRFPGRKYWFFLDNLFDLGDLPNITDPNLRMQMLSGALKDFTISDSLTTFATVEYKKSDSKSTSNQALNELMKSSKALEYDANWIGHLLNPLHTDTDTTDMWWAEEPIADESMVRQELKLPIITLITSKNKITSYKGSTHYLFCPHRARFHELHRNNMRMLRASVRQRLGPFYGDTGSDEILSVDIAS